MPSFVHLREPLQSLADYPTYYAGAQDLSKVAQTEICDASISPQTEGRSERVLSTRSVDVNLARPFKAGKGGRSIHVA